MPNQNNFRNLKNLLTKHWEVFFFLAGFVFDIFTLGEIDETWNITSQSLYLFLASVLLYFEFKTINPEKIRNSKVWSFFIKYYDGIFHFLIGSLISVFTLFYFKSTSFVTSFIFIAFILFIMIANELPIFVRLGRIFKSFLLGLCTCSFFTYIVPLLMKEIGRTPFFIGIVTSLTLLFFVYLIYSKFSEDKVFNHFLLPSFGACFLFLSLYIFKILPPVPLAIKDIGVYQKIEKIDGQYNCYHQRIWWQFWKKGDQDFYLNKKSRVHVFFTLYSPSNFSDSVIVRWSKRSKKGWIKYDDIPIKITGGRKKGFRGIAYKEKIVSGEWKVSVRSKDLREIGRIKINVYPEEFRDPLVVLSKDVF